MRIYLAGCMTKYKESKVDPWNFGTFAYAAESLRSKGHTVINPAESFDGDTTLAWEEYLKHDIPLLLTCNAIVLLGDDWTESKGARFEAYVAHTVGIPTLDIDLNPVDIGEARLDAFTKKLLGDVKQETPGYKKDEGKTRYDLLDWKFIQTVADVMTKGSAKYPAHNWARGMDWSRPFNALHRHVAAFMQGEVNDPETGYPHLAHAACCLMFLFAYSTNEKYEQYNDLHGREA